MVLSLVLRGALFAQALALVPALMDQTKVHTAMDEARGRFSLEVNGAPMSSVVATFSPDEFAVIGKTVVRVGGNGCQEITMDLVGKVALLKREGCYFVNKVLMAQSKGAVAAIIQNTDNEVIRIGGSSEGINIPTCAVSSENGEKIQDGADVSMTRTAPPRSLWSSTSTRPSRGRATP